MAQNTPFIADDRRDRLSMTERCARSCVSRTTGDAWVERALTHGPQGLAARSHTPRTSPRHTPDEVVAAILDARPRRAVRHPHPGPAVPVVGVGGAPGPLTGVHRTGSTATARPPRAHASHPERRTTRPPGATLGAHQRQWHRGRDACPHARPHEALARRTPAAGDAPSPREMPHTRPPLASPDRVAVRSVSANGGLRWNRPGVHVSIPWAGASVGLEAIERWRLEGLLRPAHTRSAARTTQAHRRCRWSTHTTPLTVTHVSGPLCDRCVTDLPNRSQCPSLDGVCRVNSACWEVQYGLKRQFQEFE